MKRFDANAGIAIGPILFVLALLGVIATVMSSGGSSSLGTAGASDRITADITSQANLIRSKILECQMQYLVNGKTYASSPCENDAYPCSDQTDGTLVSALTCPNDPLSSGSERSLWTGLRVSMLPQPTAGFDAWMYINDGDVGGRCFWTKPTNGTSTNVVKGLSRAAKKFTSDELAYDSSSSDQRFIVFITLPNGNGATNSHCVP